ncbi:MAG TPA: ubiquinone/menaquinone biosynthesis methyltransferase [Myxococcaceae bacterium]|nr:ubiquinone/menaquinone biosynthesis methyltransferase [Myxococcaceae bacterium]
MDVPARDPVRVEAMFTGIAPAYDLTNDVLSFGMHRWWKRALVKRAGDVQGKRVLDAATGTGDLAFRFNRRVGAEGKVTAIDLSEGMLRAASARAEREGERGIDWKRADVTRLPFEDESFDLALISFGIRNVTEPVQGLRELGRVTRKGGRVLVLEFGAAERSGLLTAAARLYITRILPALGAWVSGAGSAYRYLQQTTDTFPGGSAFASLMRAAGNLNDVRYRAFPGSFVYLYEATRT